MAGSGSRAGRDVRESGGLALFANRIANALGFRLAASRPYKAASRSAAGANVEPQRGNAFRLGPFAGKLRSDILSLGVDESRIENVKYIWFTGIAALTLSPAAAAPEPASDLPSYNVKKYCLRESELLDRSNSVLKFCLDQEQESYNELKKSWDSLDRRVKDYCQQTLELPSYYKVKVCITRELKAKEELGDFKFRR
jgi:hypothetical protein